MPVRDRIVLALLGALAWVPLAHANARLINVVTAGNGCVAGPSGPKVQFWDVQPGKTYQLTISNVTECGNNGTAPTLNVRINSTGSGNIDLVATNVSPGTYTFSFAMPANAACTFVIFYCTTPGRANTGIAVTRNDGGPFQAHLRASTFGPSCSAPTPITTCTTVGVRTASWGALKVYYRD